jgi:hypothetical protein
MNRVLKANFATFLLVFSHFIAPAYAKDINLETGCYFVVHDGGKNCATLKLLNSKDTFHCLDINPIVTSTNFNDVSYSSYEFEGKKEYVLHIKLDGIGREKFSRATGACIGKRVALVIDGQLVMAPIVQDKIDSGVLQLNTFHHSHEELLRFYEYLIKLISNLKGETDMGDKGKKDKGKREQQKKSQLNTKKKRKLKKEKKK